MLQNEGVISGTKEEKYTQLISQLKGLLEGESNTIANLANTAALLREVFHFWWVGFYLVEGEQLVLGPFQGPVACTRIALGKGVCGTAWKEGKSIIVPDVHKFPGHIACSEQSKSEIVIPMKRDNNVWGVLDVDSEHPGFFDETDKVYLEQVAELLERA